MPPVVSGILETSLYVADLERSTRFFGSLFGFGQIYAEGDRMRGLSVCDKQVLLLFKRGGSKSATQTDHGRIPPHDGHGTLHLAFAIQPENLPSWREKLQSLKISIESEVHCGGHSIYFRDPDDHLIELITPGCWPIY